MDLGQDYRLYAFNYIRGDHYTTVLLYNILRMYIHIFRKAS